MEFMHSAMHYEQVDCMNLKQLGFRRNFCGKLRASVNVGHYSYFTLRQEQTNNLHSQVFSPSKAENKNKLPLSSQSYLCTVWSH